MEKNRAKIPLVGHQVTEQPLSNGDDDGLTLASRIGRMVREAIISGELVAGAPLRFDVLRKRYGISVTPLREALTLLLAENLVQQEDQRGFRVAPMSMMEFDEITGLRLELETDAIERSVTLGDEDWEVRLLSARHRLTRASQAVLNEAGSVNAAWESRHRELHFELLSACQSPWRLRFCQQLHYQFDRYRRKVGLSPKVSKTIVSTQENEIVEAALARDGAHAKSLLADHIERSATQIRQALLKAESAQYDA
jgi:GntR family carbon starvation induced transcriptional regulator